MTTYTIPQKMSGTGTIHDTSGDTIDPDHPYNYVGAAK